MRPCQTGSNWVQLVQTRWQTWQYGQPDNRGRNGDWPECGRASTGPWWWRRTCQRRRRCRAPGLCWAPSRPAASAPPTGTFRCPCALHPSRCKQKKTASITSSMAMAGRCGDGTVSFRNRRTVEMGRSFVDGCVDERRPRQRRRDNRGP